MGIHLDPMVAWLIIFAILLAIELPTMGLTTIWFAAGALASFFVSMAGGNIGIQVVVFFAVSIVMLLLLRPLAQKRFNTDRVRTNAESLIGESGIVLEPIDNIHAHGRVTVRGQEWAARTVDGECLEKDVRVTVKSISGVKLMVKREES